MTFSIKEPEHDAVWNGYGRRNDTTEEVLDERRPDSPARSCGRMAWCRAPLAVYAPTNEMSAVFSNSQAMGKQMHIRRLLGGIGVLAIGLVVLTACSAGIENDKRQAIPFTPAATQAAAPAVTTAEVVNIVIARAGILDASAQESVDCKAYAAADSAGVAGDDPVLRAQVNPCWVQIDAFLTAAALLSADLRPIVDNSSAPAAIADIAEETANLFMGVQQIVLSPECRNGSAPDFDSCVTFFQGTYAVIETWADRLSPAWRAYA